MSTANNLDAIVEPKVRPGMEAWPEILRLHQSGLGFKRTAQRLGLNPHTVKALLHRWRKSGRVPHMKRYALDESAFDRDTPERDYFVGLLASDGHVAYRPWGTADFTLRLQLGDRILVDALQAFVQTDRPVAVVPARTSRDQPSAVLTVHSVTMVKRLATFGIVPRKSLTFKVSGLERSRDFWRGMIDGDGTVGTFNGWPRITLYGSTAAVEQFRDYVAGITGEAYKVVPKLRIACLTVCGVNAINLFDALYGGASIALPRKAIHQAAFHAYRRDQAAKAAARVEADRQIAEALQACRFHNTIAKRFGVHRSVVKRVARLIDGATGRVV